MARQLQEKAREQQRDLHMVFIDLTAAFDSVNREALWFVLGRSGCPPKFITAVRQLHEGTEGKVMHDGLMSAAFPSRQV